MESRQRPLSPSRRRQLLARGHRVTILESADGWSRTHLLREQGEAVLGRFARAYPRSLTHPDEMAEYDLSHFDGVLAFGQVVCRRYLELGWARQAWTWHEAADHRVFRPLPGHRLEGDLVWVGNWGEDERMAELEEFLIGPGRALKLRVPWTGGINR